jgi:hypothetical protein
VKASNTAAQAGFKRNCGRLDFLLMIRSLSNRWLQKLRQTLCRRARLLLRGKNRRRGSAWQLDARGGYGLRFRA